MAIARVFSALGHPFFTVAVFIIAVSFRTYAPGTAAAITAGVVGTVVFPAAAWNWWNARRGYYSDFDVSNRRERHSMYLVLVALMAAAALGLWWTGQPAGVVYGLVFSTVLLIVCGIVNFFLKASLHAALAFYLAAVALGVHPPTGALMLAFAFPVGWSRIALRRHSTAEVIAGSLLGCAFGFSFRLLGVAG